MSRSASTRTSRPTLPRRSPCCCRPAEPEVGRAWAAHFTWAAAAAGTWDVYDRVLAEAVALVKVALNLVLPRPGEVGGMEVYARELIPRLAAIESLDLVCLVNREAAEAGGRALG